MKTTKRGKLLMLACAALVAVLACLPLLWFRAQDARMFGTVNQSSGLYESREVSGDDFYLLQQVKNRTQMNRTDWMVSAGLDGTAALYTPAGNSRYNMTSSDTAADFAASLLTQLHDAEVLPDTWYHVAADNLSSYSSGELYTSSDSLGITRLLRYPHAAYDESDPEYNESPTFALDYDNKTGRLLNLWVQAPLDDPTLLSGSPALLNISDLLNAWVQWEGLTDLGDWTVPYGSDYAETGLYSARGNALLTCVYGSFTLDDVPRAYYSMQLTWQPYAPTPQPGSTDLLPAEPLPETSDYYYTDVIAYQWDDDRAAAVFDYDANLILRTNLSTGVQTVFCDVPGCTHTTSSCPARITDQMYSLVPAGDCVYLVYGNTELTVYSLKDNDFIKQAAVLFQKKYPDVYVNIETGMSGDDSVTDTDALKVLNTEIMAGTGPDVLLLDGISEDTYIEKGMLEDLSGVLKDTDILSNIKDAYTKEDGSIYTMPVKFGIPMIE